jgi:PII-like signaling protein
MRWSISPISLLRGFFGLDIHGRLLETKLWSLVDRAPVTVEIVDSPQAVGSFLSIVEEVVWEGLATLERAHVLLYRQNREAAQRAAMRLELPGAITPLSTLMGDGQFRMMTAEEFNNSPLPVTEKERRAERAKLREQVQKIIAGKSDIHEINVAGQVLGVGDTALVSKWGSVEVMNLSPVRSTNSSFVFKEQGHFDTGGVVAGGTIKILGFTDDKSRALVEYTLPNGAQAAGVQAPSGVQYFISVISFTQMKK